MKKYNKILTILAAGVLVLSSCSMDVKPTTAAAIDLEAGENLFNNVDELQKFEAGLYSAFRSTQYGQASTPMEVMCDGFNATVSYGNNYGSIHRTDNSFTPSDYEVEFLWEINYQAIKDYNVFLEALEKYEPENSTAAAYAILSEGEAKFFRAYAYLTLVRAFAKPYSAGINNPGVPLVLHYDQEELPARATVGKVYEQIESDINDALDCFNTLGWTAEGGGEQYVTIDACNALLARVYLDRGQFAEAAAMAASIITSGTFELSSDDDMMQDEWRNDSGTESIFQCYASLNENGSGTNAYYTQWAYSASYARYNGTGFYFAPYYLPSGKLISLYEDTDLRLNNWFTSYFRTGASTPLVNIGGLRYCTFEVFTKYYGNPALYTTTPNARQAVKPLLIGEQYLIAAEAYLAAGDATSAKQYLNDLQAARGATETEATAENIHNEWFKETVGEGLRMSCLKRWGEGFNGRAAQARAAAIVNSGSNFTEKVFSADDNHWVWPIPSYEMVINPNLTQNPGYGAE